ncbi:MAG: LysR substrate-binding domain-containing protein [Lysobacteraceae bacterium]
MRTPRLPSIVSLQALEAAARLQSYSRAAEEMHLTHGAISQRIRELESQVGAPLFRRTGNRMLPTAEAQRLLAHVRPALDALAQAFGRVATADASSVLRISTLPSLANRWLVPRLQEFRARTAQVDVELAASTELETPGPALDMSIRYGPGDWPDVRCEPLAPELLFPVCTPAYAREHGLGTPSDLASAGLLRHAWQRWSPWLEAAGLPVREPVATPRYGDSEHLVRAAEAGEGIALARGLMVLDSLRSGALVAPFPIAVRDRYRYFAVQAARPSRKAPAIALFADWLADRIREDARALSSLFGDPAPDAP